MRRKSRDQDPGRRDKRRESANEHAARGDDGECVASGDYADVWLFGEARDDFVALRSRNDETSIREAVQIGRYFSRFAQVGPQGFSDKMFKSLGRFKDGKGNERQIWEFKSYQFRIYGIIGEFRGKRSFVGTASDPSKKKNKADQQKLKLAAQRSAEVK